jgi:septum formation protein
MQHPLNIPYKIVLGSQSPRRKELLSGLGINFSVEVIPTDEDFNPEQSPEEIAMSIAIKKGNCFLSEEFDKNQLIITADTIVSIHGKILNKPKDYDEAVEMIQLLSGNKHTVYTGVCITTYNHQESFVCSTDVYFNSLSNHEIEYYIHACQPYDKAGSYGVQEWIGYVGIRKIEGCFFNVMGLPVNELYKRLKSYT